MWLYFLLLKSLKWLRNQGNLSTTWYGFTTTGQRGKWYEKKNTFDFHILPANRDISVLELFPDVVFQ